MDEVLTRALARAAYERFAPQEGRPTRLWDELDEAGQAANLDSARFAPTILTALGLRIVEAGSHAPRTALTDEEIEAGARLEHLRWARYTRAVGRTEHEDLVPWAQFTESTRELDRVRVRELPALLAQLGLAITEISTV